MAILLVWLGWVGRRADDRHLSLNDRCSLVSDLLHYEIPEEDEKGVFRQPLLEQQCVKEGASLNSRILVGVTLRRKAEQPFFDESETCDSQEFVLLRKATRRKQKLPSLYLHIGLAPTSRTTFDYTIGMFGTRDKFLGACLSDEGKVVISDGRWTIIARTRWPELPEQPTTTPRRAAGR